MTPAKDVAQGKKTALYLGRRETERVASIFRNEKNGSKRENIIKKKKPLKRLQMAVNMT